MDEARAVLEPHCRDQPRDVEGWFLLSAINGQLGRYESVVNCCAQILAQDPDHAGVYMHLGNAKSALHQVSEAIDCYREALVRRPKDPAVLASLGRALFETGELTEAEQHLRRALDIAPRSPDAHYTLANLLFTRGNLKEAIARYEMVIRLNPRLYHVYRQYAAVLQQIGDYGRSLEMYQQALILQPNDVESLRGMAESYLDDDNPKAAHDMYQRALTLDPTNLDAQAGLAKTYLRQGDFDRAYQWARNALDAGDVRPAVVLILAKTCKQFGTCDEALRLIKQLTSGENTSPGTRQALHFAAGEILDRQTKYNAAFDHFRRANELYGVTFDRAAHTAYIDGLIRTYSGELMKTLPRAAHGSQRPVFIVGMPRSGTSLVEQILANHPEIFGAGELKDIDVIAAQLSKELRIAQPVHAGQDRLTNARLDSLAASYLQRLQDLSPDATCVTDKMPHNFMHLGLINLLFPDARVVHCVRDPRDTCLSIYFQSLSPSHAYATDLADLGFYYQEYRRLMSHWRRVVDIKMIEVSYEELVADVEVVSRRLVAFCGLDWRSDCLEFYKSDRRVATASNNQVRQPVYTSSVGRWHHYAQHIEPLSQVLKNTV
ncbi:MAG: tetratricopeptide repeat-containing sulfotransferase family protein [Sulfuricaulis sp.]